MPDPDRGGFTVHVTNSNHCVVLLALFSVLLTSQWHKIMCKILLCFYCDFPPKLQNKTKKPRLETTTVLQQLTHLGHCADPFALSNAAEEDVCRDSSHISLSLISENKDFLFTNLIV